MDIQNLNLQGAHLLVYGRKADERGWFQKTYNDDLLKLHGIHTDIKESFTSMSCKDVLRGMHFQTPPSDHAKYVTVLSGSIFDVIVDLRRSSKTYGRAISLNLTANSGATLYLPTGIAHGFLALEDNTVVQYAVTSTYQPEDDTGILWSSLDIDWPVDNPILSTRDLTFPKLQDYISPF